MSQIFKVLFLLVPFAIQAQEIKQYSKKYNLNGNIKSEGWYKKGLKTDYWKFYYPNGKTKSKGHYKNNIPENYWYFYSTKGILKKEGHFINGLKDKWWTFYNKNGSIDYKQQYKKDKIDGFRLLYKDNKIFMVEKYIQNLKIQQWKNLENFEK